MEVLVTGHLELPSEVTLGAAAKLITLSPGIKYLAADIPG